MPIDAVLTRIDDQLPDALDVEPGQRGVLCLRAR